MISVVEDDASVREALDGLLRSAGLEVRGFASAEEFLGSGGPHETACLILDMRMPGMSGLELHERLSAGARQIPVILLTAHDDAAVRTRALKAGVRAFLIKPVDGDTLIAAVALALAAPSSGALASSGRHYT